MGIIINDELVHDFIVHQCPEKHAGKGRALINYKRRNGAKRFEVVKITAEDGNFEYATSIGHWGDEKIIKLDYDLRARLNLKLGQSVHLEIEKCGIFGTLYWYIGFRDLQYRVPAILSMISLALGVISIIIAVFD